MHCASQAFKALFCCHIIAGALYGISFIIFTYPVGPQPLGVMTTVACTGDEQSMQLCHVTATKDNCTSTISIQCCEYIIYLYMI